MCLGGFGSVGGGGRGGGGVVGVDWKEVLGVH